MCFHPPSLPIGKVSVPMMHFCVCRVHCKVHWRAGSTCFVQNDFSATFDRVNHQGILYKFCSVSIGSSVLFILTLSIKSTTALYGGGLWEETG